MVKKIILSVLVCWVAFVFVMFVFLGMIAFLSKEEAMEHPIIWLFKAIFGS